MIEAIVVSIASLFRSIMGNATRPRVRRLIDLPIFVGASSSYSAIRSARPLVALPLAANAPPQV